MQTTNNFSLLNIDSSLKSRNLIDNLAKKLEINSLHSDDFAQSLELLMDTVVSTIVVHININSKKDEIYKFLEMLSSDIENENTPLIVISTLPENELLSYSLSNYNIIAVYTYENWHYQLEVLLKHLLKVYLNEFSLKNELNKSEQRNIIDPLTGLFNRYGAEDGFGNLTSRYLAYKENFAAIILDIDHFKSVNDTYGHDIGDEVILSFRDIIKQTIRSTDKAIRLGGEEFLVLLGNTDLHNAVKVANKLRLKFEQNLHSSKHLEVTSSFGVALYENEKSINDLVKKVDLLLYQAKENGRNQVVHTLDHEINDDEIATKDYLQEKNTELICSNLILNQYFHATNISSIVSKTDRKGIITYVNDKFIKLAGYSEKELLGSPQSIVRDPSMPSSFFKNLWDAISSKHAWDGIIRNKRKDGSFYVVHAYIFPIVDDNDNIIEYISIRYILEE